MNDWRRSPALALTLIAVFIAVQLAVPISRLGVDDPTPRFAWQMFSTARPSPQFVVITDTGETEIEIRDFMARVRADIDILHHLPPHLCVVIPEAELVTWDGGEYRC